MLLKKRDPTSHVLFMDVVGEKRSKGVLSAWWQSLCEILTQELEASSRSSTFIKSVFVNEFPRLHGAFCVLLSRLKGGGAEGRELMRCLQVFEQSYIAKTLTKLNEPLQLMSTPSTSTSASAPLALPTRSDVNALLHSINDVLSSIHDSDEDLQVPVCANIAKALSTFAAHCERLLNINDDREAMGGATTGPTSAALSPVQRNNSELFIVLSTVEQQTASAELKRKYPGIRAGGSAKVERGWQSVHEVSDTILTHLIRNVTAQLEAVVFGLQDEDFAATRPIPPRRESRRGDSTEARGIPH